MYYRRILVRLEAAPLQAAAGVNKVLLPSQPLVIAHCTWGAGSQESVQICSGCSGHCSACL